MDVLLTLKNTKKNLNKLEVRSLTSCTKKEIEFFKKKFRETIEPVYGNQDVFLEKILSGKDRESKLLFKNTNILGFIIYKNKLSNEYIKFNISNGLEIKTFLLFSENKKLNGLYSAYLFREVAAAAVEKGAKCLFGTVSEKKELHMKFFHNLGFQEIAKFPDFYEKGVYEKLICHKNPFSLWEEMDSYDVF